MYFLILDYQMWGFTSFFLIYNNVSLDFRLLIQNLGRGNCDCGIFLMFSHILQTKLLIG